jgi:Ca-activated chloride channel homolog
VNCHDARKKLAEVVFGEIDLNDSCGGELAAHLIECGACAALLGEIRSSTRLLEEGAESASPQELSAKRRLALYSEIAALRQSPPAAILVPAGSFSFPGLRRKFLHVAAGLTAACVLVALMLPAGGRSIDRSRPMSTRVAGESDRGFAAGESAPVGTDGISESYHGPYSGKSVPAESDEWTIGKVGKESLPGLALEDSQFTDWDGNGIVDMDPTNSLAPAPAKPNDIVSRSERDIMARNTTGSGRLQKEKGLLVQSGAAAYERSKREKNNPRNMNLERKGVLDPKETYRGGAGAFITDDKPLVVHEETDVRDHFETDEKKGPATASGKEDSISDIPLGDSDIVKRWAPGEESRGKKQVVIRKSESKLSEENSKLSKELAAAEYVLSKMIKKGYDVYKIVPPGKDKEKPASRPTSPKPSKMDPESRKDDIDGKGQKVFMRKLNDMGKNIDALEKKPESHVKVLRKEEEEKKVLPVAEPAPVPDPVVALEKITASGGVFKVVPVNPFVMTNKDRLSTFSIDVDTASYTLARRYIAGGYLPPVGSVRMEEFVNSFDYNYPRKGCGTFNVISEAADAPFGRGLTLYKVGVRGKVIGREGRKPAHLVFVVDASGSMDQADRMPLVKYSLKCLLSQLKTTDRVSLISYGTKSNLLLEAVALKDKARIFKAIDQIQCEGSTNLLEGLALGYQMASREFNVRGINRVILCSDGAANIGITEGADICQEVKGFRDQGISLTSIGFGIGTYNDALLEKLSNSGDGSYAFVDSRSEARRFFIQEMAARLQMIAKDVKIQVEFDPRFVRRYRLIGYENRDIADNKFRDDTVDAGEVGSGQSATALYEIELFGNQALDSGNDLGTVYVRYRNIDSRRIEEISHRLRLSDRKKRTPASDPRFFLGACAAEFAELLRDSEHASGGSFSKLRRVLEEVVVHPAMKHDSRARELLLLVKKAQGLPRAK